MLSQASAREIAGCSESTAAIKPAQSQRIEGFMSAAAHRLGTGAIAHPSRKQDQRLVPSAEQNVESRTGSEQQLLAQRNPG